MTIAPGFDPDRVSLALAGTRFEGLVEHLATVGSTNAVALDAAARGARTGVWVADEQTAGRGRGGHTWFSAPGDGLYVSALIAPRLPIATALKISLATGLAAQRAIAEVSGLQVDLRWPNDLLLNDRKCGGILVETAVEPARDAQAAMLRYGVIGIGVNLNHVEFPEELGRIATSLRCESGREVSRDSLLIALLRMLDEELGLLENESAGRATEPLLDRFARASTWIAGKQVCVDDRYTGVTAGLSEEGFLKVVDDAGTSHVVRSGGVRKITGVRL